MEQQTKQEEMQQEQKKTSFLSDMAEVLETVFVSIFVVILLFAYVIRPVTVEGDSMRETLHNKAADVRPVVYAEIRRYRDRKQRAFVFL